MKLKNKYQYINYLFNSFFLLIIFLLNGNLYSQTYNDSNFSNEKYIQTGLVWGVLKYYHPKVSNGNYNWDLVLVNMLEDIEKIENRDEFNAYLLKLIKIYPYKSKKEKNSINNTRYFLKNQNFDWIKQKKFSPQIENYLLDLIKNPQSKDYFAKVNSITRQLEFKNEKGFLNFNFEKKSHKLLLLFNFWNTIQYWYVNKYLINEEWSEVLPKLVFEFANCKSKLDFEMSKAKLISKINDSHSFYLSKEITNSTLKYRPPFSVKNINDSLYIDFIYNKKLAELDNISVGDVIFKINSNDINSELKTKISNIISASNTNFLKKFSHFLLRNNFKNINIDILKKDGKIVNQNISLYENFNDSLSEGVSFDISNKYKLLNSDVGYINLANVDKVNLASAFDEFKSTKGIILDLRNYPRLVSGSDIADYLYPNRKEFIKVLFPLNRMPSICEFDGKAKISFLKNPFEAGRNNPDYYKGKVILLVDNQTQSNAEFIGLIIQNAPNCTTIGKQTAGSLMNVVSYVLSDKTQIVFTGLGGFYINGIEVQRNGLKIDFEIEYNARNVDLELYIKQAKYLIEN